MQPVVLGNPRRFDLATVDSGDWRAAAPVTNLQDMQPSRVARTTNLTNTFFVVEFTAAAGGAAACKALFLFLTNLSAAATLRVRGATSEANLTAAPGFDTGSISAWPGTGRPADDGLTRWSVYKQLANSTAYVWWRVDLSDAGNTDGYIEIGRGGVVPVIQPAANFTFDWSWSYQPADVVERTPFGHTLTQARARPRLFQLPFEFLTEAEMHRGIADLQRLRGTAQDLWACLDPDATTYLHDYTVQGLLGEPVAFGNAQGLVENYAGRASLVELI